jgi:beta-xylosidase
MKSLIVIVSSLVAFGLKAQPWVPDLENGKYKNPIIWADYSDPDICQVGNDFYMTSSSFNCVPALPILHSTDLVNWKIINHAIERFPDQYFNIPQHGNGVWAPSIRFHEGWFYIYWGDPDLGIYMVRTQDPAGKWEAPVLVKRAYGNIDPSPLWDDDGKVYLVHAFANSRAGVSHILQLQELSADGSVALPDKRDIIIHGLPVNNTLEGPKFYKKDGYYYIFAPAGGVSTGWQMVYRSKNIWGPYEEKRVLETGNTAINGPHQGGWVELENGENWFVHFQELQPYGRIVHLQPVKWVDGWPVMGADDDKDGTGNPVLEHKKPKTAQKSEIMVPQTSDSFDGPKYNLGWQWQANYYDHWYSLTDNKGHLRLNAVYNPIRGSIWTAPNVIAQKLPAPAFSAIAKVNVSGLKGNERTGLVMLGIDYATLAISKGNEGNEISYWVCKNAFGGYREELNEKITINTDDIYLKVQMEKGGLCQFFYSQDGDAYVPMGDKFQAREGRWIGAKIGLYTTSSQETGIKGYADYDWFRIE